MMGYSIPSLAVSRFWFQEAGITRIPQKSTLTRPECRAEGWLCRTLVGEGFCFFRKPPAVTPKRHQPPLAVRGHRPMWPPTRRVGRSASLCRAIPNAASRQRGYPHTLNRRLPRSGTATTELLPFRAIFLDEN